MYHADGWLMVLGVLLSLALVGGLVWYVNSVIPKALDERQWLTRFVALVLTVFLGVFVADLLVSWDVQLLSNELRVGLFELIKSIVLVVFGYQFGARGQAETPPAPPRATAYLAPLGPAAAAVTPMVQATRSSSSKRSSTGAPAQRAAPSPPREPR